MNILIPDRVAFAILTLNPEQVCNIYFSIIVINMNLFHALFFLILF